MKMKNLSQEKLFEGAIHNPCMISILLAGPSGSGKTYTVESVLERRQMKRRSIAAIFAPATVEGWLGLMGELVRKQVKVLIIDHVEDMPMEAQSAMFHVFSRNYGELCSFPDSTYGLKVVFTTVKSIGELRSSAEILMPHVYDRISQLIIRFDPLTKSGDLWAKFKEVWKAMNFQEHNALPKEGGLKHWISQNVGKMNGNFRDLEKLAIRWHNRRLLGFPEDEILENINREYDDVGFGAEPEEEGAVFLIPQPNGKSITWETIEADFKRHIRAWAIGEFGGLSGASAFLGVSSRTLDRWK